MSRKILTVEDTFLIKERGIVVIGRQRDDALKIKLGDSVEIIRPDETSISSQITGIDSFTRQCFTEKPVVTIGFLFKNPAKTDIPKGSIIYLTD